MNEFQNILIVRTDRIGDVVLTTPSIEALRKTYPKARITLLVAPLTFDLVDGNPSIDEIVVDDRTNTYKGLKGLFKLASVLRKKKFDLAIIYHTKKRTNALCFLAGIPRRLGYRDSKFGFLLTDPIDDVRHFGKKHEAEYCLDVLRPIGVQSTDLHVTLTVKEESERWVEQWCQNNGIVENDKLIAIHPGASDPSKRWPTPRFVELINELTQKFNHKIVLIGTAEIQSIAQDIQSSAQTPVMDATGQTTVSQLASLLKRCDLLVSNDSGPVHIADALQTPVVSIFTRNQPGINPERWRPLGEQNRVVCTSFEGKMSFNKEDQIDPSYLEMIPSSAVLEAVDSIFKLC